MVNWAICWGSVKAHIQSRENKYIESNPGGLKGPWVGWGWEGAHILCDVSLVPISKLQGIALGVRHVPPVGQEAQRGKSRVASPTCPCPPPPLPGPAALTRRTPPSAQWPGALPASGVVTLGARVRSWDEGLLRGVGWAGLREEKQPRSGRWLSDSPIDLV